MAKVVKTTGRSTSEGLVNVSETVGKGFCEEKRFELLVKYRQRLNRRHSLRQVVPDLWADNRQSVTADS